MKKHRFQTIGTNAIDPAAPAAAWGKGVPGKGGATTNFDDTKNNGVIYAEICRNVMNRKGG